MIEQNMPDGRINTKASRYLFILDDNSEIGSQVYALFKAYV